MGISSKLITTLALAAAGICYVIFRKLTSAAEKASTSGLINTLRKDPAKAVGVAEELDIPYGKRENFSEADFKILRSVLKSATTIDAFTILHETVVDEQQHLIITSVTYTDFDVDVTGKPTDIKKDAFHTFVVRYDAAEKTVSVWSHLYNDTTTKYHKEAFAKRIVNSLATEA